MVPIRLKALLHPKSMKLEKQIQGLYLWSIPVKFTRPYHGPDSDQLFITTKTRDMSVAISKAKRFLSRNKSKFRNPTMDSASLLGTLDA